MYNDEFKNYCTNVELRNYLIKFLGTYDNIINAKELILARLEKK